MRFDGCLLASDYDGTLYDENGVITEQVRAAIAYFIENGGRFTVCTGRTVRGFHAYDPGYINAPVLLANGAMCYDYGTGETGFYVPLGSEVKAPLRELAGRFGGASVEFFPPEQNYLLRYSEVSHRHITSQQMDYVLIDDPDECLFPPAKVMVWSENDSAGIQRWLRAEHPEVNFIPTSGRYVEILAPGVNKGSGLLRLAETVGAADVYAVGDGYNDVDMLTAAKLGFVPENGCAEAKAVADIIVRPNTDGAVAHVIEILDKSY